MLCLGWHLISTFWCPFNSNKNFSLGRHTNYLSLEIWSTKLNALSYLFCLSHTLLWCPEASFSQKPVLLCTTPELTCPVSWQELMIGFLATRERLGSLQTQTVEMFVWRTINIVIHRERGTSLSFSRKKRWFFFGNICFLGGLWKRIILISLHFPFLSKKVGSVELFWGYLCVKAMSTHWPWPIHHSRNTRRRVFAWQDKYLSTNAGATEAKTAIAWSCNSSYWAADQSGNPGFWWFSFT